MVEYMHRMEDNTFTSICKFHKVDMVVVDGISFEDNPLVTFVRLTNMEGPRVLLVKEVPWIDKSAFKFALIMFVKELLKPTWKEGQISKEAHMTIVKKVVDKVTGSIQAVHIPQSQEKIDNYLSSSKPKLSKLVQESDEVFYSRTDNNEEG